MRTDYGIRSLALFVLIAGVRTQAQAFAVRDTVVTVVGHNSPRCIPRAGDSQSMDLCRLKVTVTGALRKTALLPWQMASVKEVRNVSPETFVFVGDLPGGQGEVLSAQNLTRPGSEFTLIAGTLSVSPNSKLIVSEKYIPPHGADRDSVTVVLTDLNEDRPNASRSKIILDSHWARMDESNGSTLCSSSLVWSKSGEEIAACIRSLSDLSLHFILFRNDGPNWMTFEQTVVSSKFCLRAKEKDQVCSVTIQAMEINEVDIQIEASIQDNDGVRQMRLVLVKKDFVGLPNSGPNS